MRTTKVGSGNLNRATTYVSLWSGSPKPSTKIADFTNPASNIDSKGDRTFTAPTGTVLDPDTRYHIVVNDGVTSGAYLRPDIESVNAEDDDSALGWSIDNSMRRGTNLDQVSHSWSMTTEVRGYPNSASGEARLAGLTVTSALDEELALSPSFDQDTNSYTASVANDSVSVTVAATTRNADATVVIEGDDDTSTPDEATLDLAEGANKFQVIVKAQNGVAVEVYTVTVTRSSLGEVLIDSTSLPAPGGDDLVMAQSFTTGVASGEVFSVTGVSLALGAGNSSLALSNPFVTINFDSGGEPGDVLGTLRNPLRLADQAANGFVSPGGIVLEPETKYWLVINEQSDTDRLTVLTSSDSGSVTGTIGADRLTKAAVSDPWSTDATRALFAIHGQKESDSRTTAFTSLSVTTSVGREVLVSPAAYDDGVLVYEVPLVANDTAQIVISVAPETGGSRVVMAGDTDPSAAARAVRDVAVGLDQSANEFAFTVDSGSAGSATYTVKVAGRPRDYAGVIAFVRNTNEATAANSASLEQSGATVVRHQGFHTGDYDLGYQLEDVGLAMRGPQFLPDDGGEFTVDLHELNGDGTLGDFVVRLAHPATLQHDATNRFTAPLGTKLEPDTDYAVRLAKNTLDGHISIATTNSNAETLAAGEIGWTVNNGHRVDGALQSGALKIDVRGRRWPSSDNTLRRIVLFQPATDADAEFTPVFEADTLEYSAVIPARIDELEFTVYTSDATSEVPKLDPRRLRSRTPCPHLFSHWPVRPGHVRIVIGCG